MNELLLPVFTSLNPVIPGFVTWLLTYAIHSTLLISCIWLVTMILNPRDPGLKNTLWKAALLGAILTTSLQLFSGLEPVGGKHLLSSSSEIDNEAVISKLKETAQMDASLATVLDSCKTSATFFDNCTIPAVPQQMLSSNGAYQSSENGTVFQSQSWSAKPDGQNSGNHLSYSFSFSSDEAGEDRSAKPNKVMIKRQAIDAFREHPQGTALKMHLPEIAATLSDSISAFGMLITDLPEDSVTASVSLSSSYFVSSDSFSAGSANAISGMLGQHVSLQKQNAFHQITLYDFSWLHWVTIFWLCGCLFFGFRYFLGWKALRNLLKDRQPLTSGPLSILANQLEKKAGLKRPVHLSISANISSPMAISSREICIPSRALKELNAEQQQTMLAHEMAHIVRRDPLWLKFAAMLDILFFFQPLNRFARRGYQESAEYLCDDWAVIHTGQQINLARCLTQVAEWLKPATTYRYAAAMSSGGSVLKRRVVRILDDSPQTRNSRTKRWPLLAIFSLLLLFTWSAPLVSADFVQGNMYVFMLDSVNITDNLPSETARKIWVNTAEGSLQPVDTQPKQFKVKVSRQATVNGFQQTSDGKTGFAFKTITN